MGTTLRYGNMEGGEYLLARFGFTFTDDPRKEVQAVQDALFTQAAEVARRRTGLRRMIKSMVEDFGYMTKALDAGDLYYPLGDGPARDPYRAARHIEEAERALELYCKAVAKLQQNDTTQEENA